MIFHEEYARSDAPVRVGLIGEGMVGPTLIAFGTDEQKARLLPPIQRGEELWCQLYSEPNAGSDLANVATKAVRDGDDYVITGQKVWTSLAHWSDWGFAIVRTEARLQAPPRPVVPAGAHARSPASRCARSSRRRARRSSTRSSSTARASSVDNLVGAEGDGWKIGMATLGFERGSLTLGQQIGFRRELERVMELARTHRGGRRPVDPRSGCRTPGSASRSCGSTRCARCPTSGRDLERTASIGKLYWSTWHRELGELAMDVLGMASTVVAEPPYELLPEQSLFLFSRSDTIYAGSSEIQRNIIAERALGLPKEPTGA